MYYAHACPKCGFLQPVNSACLACGVTSKRIRTLPLRPHLPVDVTISLRFDSDLDPFLLVQKPSGQARIQLNEEDILVIPA